MITAAARYILMAGRIARPFILSLAYILLSALAQAEERETPLVKAIQRARGAVVNIRGEKYVRPAPDEAAPADFSRRVSGMGTGVVIDQRGYIITNYHVVDGVREIQVTTVAGRRYVAKLLARDSETDLAIIKIDAQEPLPVMPLGTSSDLMPGETVIAVGNAYGYEHTVTRGIISALHRAVQVSDAQFYNDLIQTDASINPGNSGGPLLNIEGKMIGLNVAVRAGAQGIGFAIPVNKVAAVAAALLAACNAQQTRIGIVSSVESSEKEEMIVGAVEADSPAAKAGLRAGDIIVAVDNTDVRQPLDFQRAMLERKPGENVQLAVRRSNELLALKLTLGEATVVKSDQPAWELLGLELQPLSPAEFRQRQPTRYRGGLLVTAVRPNSPAAEQGIMAGDVLVGMHIWETASLENVAYILKRPDLAALSPMKFFILRNGETLYGYFTLSPTAASSTKTAQR